MPAWYRICPYYLLSRFLIQCFYFNHIYLLISYKYTGYNVKQFIIFNLRRIKMSKKLNGKVAVVTGASKGIGAAIAKQLAADGASVVVNYSSSKSGADKVVSEITAQGGKAVAVGANLSEPAVVSKLFAETKTAYGRVDILV